MSRAGQEGSSKSISQSREWFDRIRGILKKRLRSNQTNQSQACRASKDPSAIFFFVS